jgi:hypothetical protein
VGLDRPEELAHETWAFLLPCLEEADAYVFSRESFAWEASSERIVVIAPSIDPFALKNEDLNPDTVRAVLQASGEASRTTPTDAGAHLFYPARTWRPWLTTVRALACCARPAPCASSSRRRRGRESTWPACRWTIPRRTRSSSTRSSGMHA